MKDRLTVATASRAFVRNGGSNMAANDDFPWQPIETVGEGASSVVFRAAHTTTGVQAALKVGKPGFDLLSLLEQIGGIDRRWGPKLLDAGIGRGIGGAGTITSSFLVTEWTEGEPLAPLTLGGAVHARLEIAAKVAHGVARALEELHEAGIRHGDVKPANILITARDPVSDTPRDRAATLIDLGLARPFEDESGLLGTPRYFAPEALSEGEQGPASDLYALGLTLAETLDESMAKAADLRQAASSWDYSAFGEPGLWAFALLAGAPGGRPSAAWVAEQAARYLNLEVDEEELKLSRVARVKRAYLSVRSRDLAVSRKVSSRISPPARGWAEEAIEWANKRTGSAGADRELPPLRALGVARWLVALVGPAAASWPLDTIRADEGVLAQKWTELSETTHPSAWTLSDVRGVSSPSATAWDPGVGEERAATLAIELAKPAPRPAAVVAAEADVVQGRAPHVIGMELAKYLVRVGEVGRAWICLAADASDDAVVLRAEIARRRGDPREAARLLGGLSLPATSPAGAKARAILARIHWDKRELSQAEKALVGVRGPVGAEVRALIAYVKGAFELGLVELEEALVEAEDTGTLARLLAVRGMIEHARGQSALSLLSYGRAAELAAGSGAVVEEATYRTAEAAAAADTADIGRALTTSTRAALLFERLGRSADAARAWLARASALITVGAFHDGQEAAAEAYSRAMIARDHRGAAYALWALIEMLPPGDPDARGKAVLADTLLADGAADDRLRASARLLLWAPASIDAARIRESDLFSDSATTPAQWEWWGARATKALMGDRTEADADILRAQKRIVDLPSPLGERGPALSAAVRLAQRLNDNEAAEKFEAARREAVARLEAGTPVQYRAQLAHVMWARATSFELPDVAFSPVQISQLETIVRSLGRRDSLQSLLNQVLDTMILWTGVERGLLLLNAPGGRLVPRAARNMERRDLSKEQSTLSQTLARRAIETSEPVVTTDAMATQSDLHASVHALHLRSVLAVPLLASGETLGVVYLDDRARRGAFGPRELAWVKLVASQAAMAIADARARTLLRREARRAERAKNELSRLLSVRDVELDATRAELQATRGEATRFSYEAIIGRSEPIRSMLRVVDRVTVADVPVLIVGESGTGKELLARAIHVNGPRAKKPFVTENCGAVPESLLESTLFGHVRGAFTGAIGPRAGLFEVADGGTLLLDEIGEMPMSMQTKLLRVLQSGEIRPVGSERERKVNVRVIAATHRDLRAMVAAGTFREDLLYRLDVVSIHVPPLRERRADIPLIVSHLLAKHSEGGRAKVTRAAMERLVAFAWPGNVRQLENEIRRAIVLSEGKIDVDELSPELREAPFSPSVPEGEAKLTMRDRIDALEADLVRQALTKTGGNQTKSAELLGLSRFGLQKMLKRLKISVNDRE